MEYFKMIELFDAHLDDNVAEVYKEQPLAQDWARVCKVAEELGEAITDLIAYTGQNPRKGKYGEQVEMLKELADIANTATLAIQHFTKNREYTEILIYEKLRECGERVGLV